MLFLYFATFAIVTSCFTKSFSNTENTIALIKSTDITKNKLKVIVNQEFKNKYLREDFFIKYHNDDVDLTKLDYSIVIMPFLLNVISMVWNSGKRYTIPSLDSNLYASLEIIKKNYIKMYPNLPWTGELIPDKLVKNKVECNTTHPESIALTFSGGLDSTFSCFAHFDQEVYLISAWGHPDIPLNQKEKWAIRKKQLLSFAQAYNKKLSFFESNYITFINWNKLNRLSPAIIDWRLGTLEGLSLTGLVAPLLVSKKICELRIASSYTWSYPYATAANPFVDNNIRFAGGIRVIHDGFEFNRHDKINYIVNVCKDKNLKKPFLKVCDYQATSNCCDAKKCKKCLSTIISLMVLNEDWKAYGFNIERNEAIHRVQTLLAPDILCETFIRKFGEIQSAVLKDSATTSKKIPSDLEWLLSIDFTKKKISDKKYGIKVNWLTDFQEFLPEGLVLPKTI